MPDDADTSGVPRATTRALRLLQVTAFTSSFDRLMIAVERALRDPADRMVVIEAATQVAVTVARVVSLAAVGRASRDRAARLREELAQRQLREVLEKQRSSIVRLEFETKDQG